MPESWQALYGSPLQSLWSLLPISLATLVGLALGLGPRAGGAVPVQAPLVLRWVLVFSAVSLADALVTSGLLPLVAANDSGAGLAVVIAFVLLGDFRVFLLFFALGNGGVRRLREVALRAAGWTLIVPLATVTSAATIRAFRGSVETSTIWLLYEVSFCLLASWLRAFGVRRAVDPDPLGRRAWLRSVLGLVALYYALWAAADVTTSWLHQDIGWALRMLPNQLYYGVLVPFVWLSFFAHRYAAASSSAQASR